MRVVALRGGKPIKIADWLGLQTFAAEENLANGWWRDSSNIVVSNDGSAQVLRSPGTFNDALTLSSNVLSSFDYDKNSGNVILFDVMSSDSVATYSTSGSTNTRLRVNQANARFVSQLVNDFAYRVNGTEALQTNAVSFYSIGITSYSTAPTVSLVAGGAGSLGSGVTVSQAYRNSTTGHVSQPSAASASSGASGANLTLRIAVTASTQTGVDGIVLFISEDGGSVRYLYTNSAGDPVINANSTGNIDISLALLTNLDTLTPETAYNEIPPADAEFIGRWGDRLCLLGFSGATTRGQIRYNVYENCYYGIPWESWWSLNAINIPSRSDRARALIETPIGALVLAEQDAFLIRGRLTDKISAPQATVSVTEHIQPLNWSIGTRSPLTLKTTPFGEMWLDQNKRIQLWTRDGFPTEAGLPIRTSLAAILDTDAGRKMAEAVWFQHGDQGGHYVLTASTTGTTNNKLFIITVYKDPETAQLRFACAVSDIGAQCLMVAEVSGKKRLFIGEGSGNQLLEIFASGTAGAGWTSTQERYFETVMGNQDEFNYWHSLKFDASNITGLRVTIANKDGSEEKQIELEQVAEDGTDAPYYGLIDAYGFRKVIKFDFGSDDTQLRVIKNLRVAVKSTARII